MEDHDFEGLLREVRRARVRSGMASKSDAGYAISQAKLGYALRKADGGAVVVTEKRLAPLIRQAFELAAGGESLRKVAARLAADGLTGRRGGPIGVATIQRVLTDPYYMGREPRGRHVPPSHEPLVSGQLFAMVQRALRKRRCS